MEVDEGFRKIFLLNELYHESPCDDIENFFKNFMGNDGTNNFFLIGRGSRSNPCHLKT